MEHKKTFSRIGLSLFVMMLVVNVIQILTGVVVSMIAPELTQNSWYTLILLFLSMHVIGFLIFYLMMKPEQPQPYKEKRTLSPLRFVELFIICMGLTYLFNFVSIGINSLIALIKQSPVTNPLEAVVSRSNLLLQILVIAVSAPVVEELVFRKLILDRLRPYGDRTAIWVSALLFALFHGNLSQALYAMVLGMIFAYIVIRTNNIRNSIALHVTINLFGSALLPMLAGSGILPLVMAAGILIWVFLIAGVILFIKEVRHIELEEGEITLKRSERFKIQYLNVGMILYFIFCLATFILAILV